MADSSVSSTSRTLTETAVRRGAHQDLDPEKRDDHRRRSAERALAARRKRERESAARAGAETAPAQDESADDRGSRVDLRA